METIILLLFFTLPMAKGAMPGTFFWKPRMGIDLAIPTTETTMLVHQPGKAKIAEGLVVMIDGYQCGITIIALAAGLSSGGTYPHFDPMSAYFYTNVYRWGLRHLSLLPAWMSGHGGNYVATHRVWKRRFYYLDEFMPEWLQYLVPYVKKEEWDKEKQEHKWFKKYSEPAFGKHYRYPSKKFNDFKSEITTETVENVEVSSQTTGF